MSKMNKKLPALFLALVLVLGMTACGGKATDGTTGSTDNTVTAEEEDHKTQNTKVDPNSPITEEMLRNHAVAPAEDFTYDVEDDGIKIRSYTGSDTVVVIPEEIEGKPVTALYKYVFGNNSPVRAVLIPESVPCLISNFTIAITTILGYSAMSGIIGGGGLGKIAINYGYYRYKYLVMLIAVVLLIVLVQIFQSVGTHLSVKSDKRLKGK